MSLTFEKHEPISLKKNSEYSEKWLQDTIADDPTILGLGELDVIDRERTQESSGRLDMLLADSAEHDFHFIPDCSVRICE